MQVLAGLLVAKAPDRSNSDAQSRCGKADCQNIQGSAEVLPTHCYLLDTPPGTCLCRICMSNLSARRGRLPSPAGICVARQTRLEYCRGYADVRDVVSLQGILKHLLVDGQDEGRSQAHTYLSAVLSLMVFSAGAVRHERSRGNVPDGGAGTADELSSTIMTMRRFQRQPGPTTWWRLW